MTVKRLVSLTGTVSDHMNIKHLIVARGKELCKNFSMDKLYKYI